MNISTSGFKLGMHKGNTKTFQKRVKIEDSFVHFLSGPVLCVGSISGGFDIYLMFL